MTHLGAAPTMLFAQSLTVDGGTPPIRPSKGSLTWPAPNIFLFLEGAG